MIIIRNELGAYDEKYCYVCFYNDFPAVVTAEWSMVVSNHAGRKTSLCDRCKLAYGDLLNDDNVKRIE